MGGADGEAESVGGSDRGHGGDFRHCALGVGEMALADFFPHRDNNSLPSNHGAEAESHGYRDLHPKRNEAGGVVDVLFVISEDGGFGGSESRVVTLLHQADGFADEIHIIAEVAHLVVGDVLHLFVKSGFVADVGDQGAQREHGVGGELFCREYIG